MCSECGEDHEPICEYCGSGCLGGCDNPDVCRSCWYLHCIPWDQDNEDFYEEQLVECIKEHCACNCHEEEYDDLYYRNEAGVLVSIEEGDEPYGREGIFPFLELPGEIREKIYDFAFLQDGQQRKSPNHRGTIHTALLGTCRQIYNEARHLPLTLTKLCFGSAIFAHDFLGFLLEPTQRGLVTGVHVELYMSDFSNSSWQLLLRELAKMSIDHLGLTIKGGVPKQALSGHTCFTNRFKVLKELKTFDLIIASAFIKDKDKKDIQEDMREALINGYTRPKEPKKSKAKRVASADIMGSPRKTAKKAKKANTLVIKRQAKIVVSPKSRHLSFESMKPERDAAKAAKERAKQRLLDQYDQLKHYATSIDSDATPVKIRLKQAREAAEAVDETKFEKLAHGIFLTLEELYNKITTARKDVPVFRTPSPSPEPMSSPELIPSSEWSMSSSNSQDLSELSV